MRSLTLLFISLVINGAPSYAAPTRDQIISEYQNTHTYLHLQKLLPQARATVESRLGLTVPPVHIYLTQSAEEMRQLALNHHGAVPPSWSGGLAFARTRQVYLPLQSDRALEPLHSVDYVYADWRRRMTEAETDPSRRSSGEDAERGERGLIVSRRSSFVTASRV